MISGIIAAIVRSIPALAKLSQMLLDALRDFQTRGRTADVAKREEAKRAKLDAAVRDALRPDGVPGAPDKTQQP